jgi:putative transposase
MKKTKYSEEQIAFALRQEEAWTPVADILRKMGVSEATFYRRKKKFGGMGVAELRRLRQLEEENHKLKQLVADLSLDKKMLQDVLAKKSLTPAGRREVVEGLMAAYRVSERRACSAMAYPRSSQRYEATRDLAGVRVRYGYRRLHVLLRREGWEVNYKRVDRLYCQ